MYVNKNEIIIFIKKHLWILILLAVSFGVIIIPVVHYVEEVSRFKPRNNYFSIRKLLHFSTYFSINDPIHSLRNNQSLLSFLALYYPASNIRREATRYLTDPMLRTAIALDDPEEGVRIIAMYKLTDPKLMEEMAFKDPSNHVRLAAINKLADEKLYEKFILNEKDARARVAVAKKLSNQNLLASIASTDPDREVRLTAMTQLKDEERLKTFALHDPDASLRLRAIVNLQDQKLLTQIALNDTDEHIRSTAIKKIHAHENLAHIVIHAVNLKDRQLAKMGLLESLLKIGLNDSDPDTRIKAIGRYKAVFKKHINILKNDSLINDPDPKIRKQIFSSLIKNIRPRTGTAMNLIPFCYHPDIEMNHQIVEKFMYVRNSYWIPKLKYQQSLINIIKFESHSEIRSTAVRYLKDNEMMTDIALNDRDAIVRMTAIKKVVDQNVLYQIARSDTEEYHRNYAASRIKDQDSLAAIVQNDKDIDVRLTALRQLTNPESLASLAFNDSSQEIRRAAVKKIADAIVLENLMRHEKNNRVNQCIKKRLMRIKNPNQDAKNRLIKNDKPDDRKNPLTYAFEVYKIPPSFIIPKGGRMMPFISRSKGANKSRPFATNKVKNDADVDPKRRIGLKPDPSDNDPRYSTIPWEIDRRFLSADGIKESRDFESMDGGNSREKILELSLQASDDDKRKIAISRITDPVRLTEVAKNDTDPKMRVLAVRKITERERLTFLGEKILGAENHSELIKLLKATNGLRLTEKKEITGLEKMTLIDIARHDPDLTVRKAAVEMLTDQDVLEDIALHDANHEIRRTATWKLTDPKVLTDLTLDHSDAKVCRIARWRLKLRMK